MQRRTGFIVPRAFSVALAMCAALLIGMPAQQASAKAFACGTTTSHLDVNGDGYDDAVVVSVRDRRRQERSGLDHRSLR